MKVEILKSKILKNIRSLYQFAYILIPDDLQASQIVLDILSLHFLHDKEKISGDDDDYQDSSANDHFESLMIYLYSEIYKVGAIRCRQLNLIEFTSRDGDFQIFYRLPLDERAVLFLRTHLHMTAEAITKVLKISIEEYYQKLNQSRHGLMHTCDRPQWRNFV